MLFRSLLRAYVHESLCLTVGPGAEVTRVRHSIMNRRIESVAYRCTAPKGRACPVWHIEARWVTPAELETLALPSPHKRLARCLSE